MKKIAVLFLLIISIMLASCGSMAYYGVTQYSKTYPLHSTCLLKKDFWGNWDSRYNSQKTITKYDDRSLLITIYSYSHPSDFNIQIVIDKLSQSNIDKEWSSYTGYIVIGKYNYIDMNEIDENGNTYKCEIWCDKKMTKAIKKNGLVGTVNVFYNNGGRGFLFSL